MNGSITTVFLVFGLLSACAPKSMNSYLADHGNGGLLTALADSNGAITQARKEKDVTTCKGYGFVAGTDAFANCMLQQDQNRKTSAQLKQLQQPHRSPYSVSMGNEPVFRPSVRCNSSRLGRDVVTDCH